MSEVILSRLAEAATEARAHYQVWWAIEHDGRKSFLAQLNHYYDFFEATRIAHFRAMIVAAWKPFDSNSRTASFSALLNSNPSFLTPGLETAIRAHIAPSKMITALHQVRHLFVAHRNAAQTAEKIFRRADVTPFQLSDLIDGSADIVRELQRSSGITNTVFESDRGYKSTIELFEALAK
ncbi:hypothetical protein BG841_14465 [Marinobacter sp. X15-166B]|nr:hypothetical protein BG841_14465 [Marinobacter sp. X15-166B]